MLSKEKYKWNYCSLGGVTRVNIATGEDIAHLDELDKKMWTVLSCPTKGLELDTDTLKMLDTDEDGKIRVEEVVAAAKWLTTAIKDPNMLLKGDSTLPFSAFNEDSDEGKKLLLSARQILKNLGLDKDNISVDDTKDRIAIFAKTRFNGDGVITMASTEDEQVAKDIESCMQSMGSLMDRSGENGIDAERIEAFYAALADFADWYGKSLENANVRPYGDNTAAAREAVNALKDKVTDFFLRCRFIAFDENCTTALDVNAEKVAAIGGDNLAQHEEEIASYPLARPNKEGLLPLNEGINPAWRDSFAKLKALIFDVTFAGKESITEEDWDGIVASFGEYDAWMGEKKGSEVEGLGADRVLSLLKNNNKETLLGLVEKDNALKDEVESIENVDKLLHLYRDFYKLLRNYVIFTDLYDRSIKMNTTFQAGQLFIDQRCCELCIRVEDMGKHANIASASGMFLVYCKCTSKVKNETMDIAAVLTRGDVRSLYVGQNAIFYDRAGLDWDATVTKIVDNPISVGYAFGTPYRKAGKWISDQVDKIAADKDAKANADMGEKLKVENLQASATPADPTAVAPKKPPFDIAKFAGIFAAIGLAVGAIGVFLTTMLTGFMALKWWQMILVVALLLLLISGPAMFIAWRKLKNRDLGPVLNANGWAINAKVIVNSRFGTTLTSLAQYPAVKTDDPYAMKTPLWRKILRWIIFLAIVCGIGWFIYHSRQQQKAAAEAAAEAAKDSIAKVEAVAATPTASTAAVAEPEAVPAEPEAVPAAEQ